MVPDTGVAAVCPDTFQGQRCLRLTTAQGDSALVALHGAQVLSWVAGGRERLYVSPQAVFDGKAAIRGGIPVCFPQFNQRGALPKHGFVRNLPWQHAHDQQGGRGSPSPSVCLELADSEATHAVWPQPFVAHLTVTLSEGCLRVALSVRHAGEPGTCPWDFTAALHTYLHVDDVERVHLSGLDGCARWDALADARGVHRGDVTFDREYDSVFSAPAGPLCLQDGAHRLQVTQSTSLGNTVVWNPGAALCARLQDMPCDGYRSMLCVEAAQIDQRVSLAPQAQWQGWQELRAVPGR